MINKENFVKHIKKYEELINKKTELYNFGVDLNILDEFEYVILDILIDTFKDEGDWISYFCFDLDFGKKYEKGVITDIDNNDINLENAENLYEFIMNNLLDNMLENK